MGKTPRYEEVARQIVGYIRNNNLMPGHKLPGGAKLSAIFNVSKNVIFEALDYLANEGVIDIRQSSGCYVTQNMWYDENEQLNWERFMNYRHNTPSTHILQKTRAVRGSSLHLSILMAESSFGYNAALRGAMQDTIEDIGRSDKLLTLPTAL
jgi:DNA-binding GntR family transcriptional regulator